MTPTESFQTVEFYLIGIFYPNETINRKRMISKKKCTYKKVNKLSDILSLRTYDTIFLVDVCIQYCHISNKEFIIYTWYRVVKNEPINNKY